MFYIPQNTQHVLSHTVELMPKSVQLLVERWTYSDLPRLLQVLQVNDLLTQRHEL